MANKKFSEFTLKTDPANVDFLVGYDGTDNVRIDPSNLGGGGASDLNGLSDCTADTTNNFIGNVPSSVSGAIQNTSLGINALNPITSGSFNVGIGYSAGSTITTGSKNTTVGRAALANVSTNSGSTAIGYQAGFISTAGDSVYVGNEAGRGNTATGHISIGYQAGYSNTSGIYNTNVGYRAGYSNTTNSKRTCVGYKSAEFHTGSLSTFIGYQAGLGVSGSSTGTQNTGVGRSALESLRNGGYNTALGSGAGNAITSGSLNVAIGRSSAGSLTTGDNNIVIGHNANVSSSSVNNEITLGDSSIATLRCAVTSITSLSDERDKSEIEDLSYGLAFIDALQPREFVWDNRPETRKEVDEDGNETEVEFYSANKGKKDFGFIAQEVRELDNDTLRLVYTENEDKLE